MIKKKIVFCEVVQRRHLKRPLLIYNFQRVEFRMIFPELYPAAHKFTLPVLIREGGKFF